MSQTANYDQIIYNVAIEEGLSSKLAGFMVQQAKFESNDYQSDVFKDCNNSYGYKYVGQSLSNGPCNGSPEGDAYAGYNSVKDSAREIARWIKRREDQFKDVNTSDEYSAVLKKNGYFGDNLANYQKGLKRYSDAVKNLMNQAITKHPTETILTGITFFGLLGYYIYRVVKKK
jgi:hypothetical protein